MSNKIDEKNIINFIDIIFYKISDIFIPILYKYNISPNCITIIGVIIGLLSSYYLYNGEIINAFILIIISAFLDCLDGHYARKYKLQSKLGYILDTGGDILKFIVLIYVLYVKYYDNLYEIRYILLILIILNMIYENCIYLYLKKKDKIGLNTHLCMYPEKYRKNMMYITSYFINTSIIFIIYLYIIYKNYKNI